MRNIFITLSISILFFGCSSNNDDSKKDSIEWTINGVKYTNGALEKGISSSIFEIAEKQNGLYLYIESDDPITQNMDYNSSNASVGITVGYDFEPDSVYDEINYGDSENIHITENNSEFISGTFTATDAVFFDNESGKTAATDYDIENGKFKIYKNKTPNGRRN